MGTAKEGRPATLALPHLAPRPGEIARNKLLVEHAVARASEAGACFAITPELVVSGYGFRDIIGTDWIARDQVALFAWVGDLAQRASLSLLLATPEAGRHFFNSLILFGPDGEWERASLDSRRPVLVCNRTREDSMDFRGTRSVAAVDGAIVHSHSSPESAIILVDWTAKTRQLSNWRVIG